MTQTIDKEPTSEPQTSAARFRERLRKRNFADRVANKFVVLGGVAIIFSILAIFIVIFAEVLPLFQSPTTESQAVLPAQLESRPMILGCDEYQEYGYAVSVSGEIRFTPLQGGLGAPPPQSIPGLGESRLVSVAAGLMGHYAVGSEDGRVFPFQVLFETQYRDGKRSLVPSIQFEDPISLDSQSKRPVKALAFAAAEAGFTVGALLGDDELILHSVKESRGMFGGGEKQHTQRVLRLPTEAKASALLLDNRAEDLFVGLESGRILHYEIPEEGDPVYGGAVEAASRSGASIRALTFLLGDRTIIVGDSAGGVSSWQIEQYGGAERRIQRMQTFESHGAPIAAIAASWRDKGFLTADLTGRIEIHYGTTGATLLGVQGPSDLAAAFFAPKADGFLAIDGRGGISRWHLDNPHPETTFGSIFGKVWYEGYHEPEYVWQSTGGTDDFEAKFSLVPLIFGTLKGTLYALLFAVPIALLAALYTSNFMHPRLRGIVKPTVEIMAAMPSVVLGFLAGLWIAPNIEKVVPGIFLMPVVLPVSILCALGFWRLLPLGLRGRFHAGAEIALLIPVVLLGSWLAFSLGWQLEASMLHGDYRDWMRDVLGVTYDQRNSLVVGFAMGFAVIPIIFTIAEDSLSNVPQHLTAGSLALGATRWQTALRIVLPTASPGIFSAVMIGFGRAVGETMIVLMATGNTPVMDLSVFSGFRALSANIAVELPEAPEGGTLYRVLFLAALLLFLLTFAVNTVAEVVRLRLRKKYRYL